MKYFTSFLFLIVVASYSVAQNRAIDSLRIVIKTDKDDTNEVIHLNLISREFDHLGDFDTAIHYANEAMLLSNSSSVPASISADGKGKGWPKGTAQAYNNIGVVYWEQGKYNKALECHFTALKIREEIDDKKGIASSYNNIGLVYQEQGNYAKALENHLASLKIKKEIGDKKGIASSYNNIGLNYTSQAEGTKNADSAKKFYKKALESYFGALEIDNKLGDKRLEATDNNNIGVVYYDQAGGQSNQDSVKAYYDRSLESYFKALDLRKKIGDKKGIVSSYCNIGNAYLKKHNIIEAKQNAILSLELARTIGANERMKEDYRLLALCDSASGDWKSAYEDHVLYKEYTDSIFNEENAKKTAELSAGYAETQLKLLEKDKEKQAAIAEAESKKNKTILLSVLGCLFLAVVFAVFMFNRWRMTQKQKKIIEDQKQLVDTQKEIVEEKNKSITDSINYAKLIQQAKLPKKEDILSAFPQSFILHRPKDIVSGDFHYFKAMPRSSGGDTVFIAAADCTGHGVPGAFMSIICSEKLDDAVLHSSNPSEILNQLNIAIKKSLHQTEKDESSRDGMDIALCVISNNGNGINVSFSGANRPLWLIRKGEKEVEEIKATKKAIGGFTNNSQVFELHKSELQKGDTFYIFSDGYPDQFGGPKDKKLTSKRFKQILLDIQGKPMQEQEKYLDAFIEGWKTRKEQVDDILVIGVRV